MGGTAPNSTSGYIYLGKYTNPAGSGYINQVTLQYITYPQYWSGGPSGTTDLATYDLYPGDTLTYYVGKTDASGPTGQKTTYEERVWSRSTRPVNYTVSVVVGSGVGSAWGGGTVSAGSPVAVYASSSGHWVFDHWSTDKGLSSGIGAGGYSSTWSFTPSASQTAYAHFNYVNTPPIGSFDWATGSLTQGDTLSGGGWAADQEQGAPVTRVELTVDGGVPQNAALGGYRGDVASNVRSDYGYSGWGFSSGTSGLSPGWHTVSATAFDDNSASTNIGSKSFYVNARTFTLNASSSSGGWVSGGGTYSSGQWAGVTAYADYGYYFAGFSNAAWGTGNPQYVYMDSDKSVYAQFYRNTYQVYGSVNGSGSIGGTGGNTYGSWSYLTAYPSTGYYFSGWSGALGGTGNGQWLYVDGDKSVTANFTPYSYAVTTAVSGSGSVSGGGTYTYGQTATITATPSTGWYFTGFSGDASGTTNPQSFTVDGAKSITANFARLRYTVTTATMPSGIGSVSGAANYNYGETATITAPNLSPAYNFTGFSGAVSGASNPQSFTVTGNAAVTAHYTTATYTLTATYNGTGSVSAGGTYNYGTVRSITATPGTGQYFAGWSGAATGTTNPINVTVDANKTLVANFVPNTYPITTNTAGSGSGSVTGGGNYTHGASATLTASAATGSTFSSWTGGLTGSTNPRTITVNASLTATANFTLNNYVLNTSTNGTGSGTVTPSGTYPYGTVRAITATAATGSTFTGWSGAASGSTNPINITVDSDKSLQAHFGLNTYTVTAAPNPSTFPAITGTGTFNYGQTATLTAPAVNGYSFTGWSGSVTSAANPLSIVVDADKALTATYAPNSYTVTVSTSPAGLGTVTGGGTYLYGQQATLTALTVTGYTFTQWTGTAGSALNPVSFIVDGNKSYVANYSANRYSLSVTTIGSGTATGSGTYSFGQTVSVTATPATGWLFAGFTGSAVSSSSPTSVLIDGNKTVTASFARRTYTLSTAASGSGAVTAGGTYNAPDPSVTAVTIIATPAAATRYIGFTGNTTGTTASNNADGTGSLYVPMTMDRAVVANFASKLPQTISFAAIGTHSVNETFADLLATASSGLPVTFTLISGPATLSGSRLTFTGTGPITVVANQPGNYTYFAAPPVQQNATVVAAPVTSLREDEGESKINDGEKEEGNFHPRR